MKSRLNQLLTQAKKDLSSELRYIERQIRHLDGVLEAVRPNNEPTKKRKGISAKGRRALSLAAKRRWVRAKRLGKKTL